MIFGGLEIVAGGYFVHKYYKNKNEKRKLEEEAQQQRSHTFPPSYPSRPHFQQQEQLQPNHYPQQTAASQKYACHAPTPTRPQFQTQARPQHPRPKPTHAQTFNIPRRPVPQRKPDIIMQPSLQRADSMATLSRMPIANGYRPTDVTESTRPSRRPTIGLSPVQQSLYGNAAFSVSSPALGATSTSPPMNYVTAPERGMGGLHSADDDWEAYEHGPHMYSAYAPTEASTQLGEQDPPPPYAP